MINRKTWFETFLVCFENTQRAVNEFTERGFMDRELLDRSIVLFKKEYALYLTLKHDAFDVVRAPGEIVVTDRIPKKTTTTILGGFGY